MTLLMSGALLLIGGALCAAVPTRAAAWDTLSLPHFYLYSQPSDQDLAQTLADQANAIFQSITADVGYTPQRHIAVYLCPTPACFQQKQPSRVKLPTWAVGVAYPTLNRIVIRSALTSQERGSIDPLDIFTHELAHIVLEQALQDRGGAPRWLSEGFSMYHARQWTIHGQRTIEEVTLRDDFIPLSVLTRSFPADEQAARIAYAQSFSLVAFLLNDYGQRIFHRFIDNLQAGMETNAALIAAAGVNLKRLELEWQASLKKRYSWLRYLANIGMFWFLLSIVFVIIYGIKRWKVKRIQARWEEEEWWHDAPESFAHWPEDHHRES
ncbi:hypothetical protein GF339_08700 [candidate division KSB3 bacterium]|uniref:Peptidase MA-like domain-containing protein n=1 Tax=candidate division KSB3 bacterium TaxID=2044937 RepID=A0A9D5JV23_9BACT|nr:hypothetical protein [candidate division KSB3 bacterium]MBD3324649.1 hypothetical protein [candidate division KSB3 bacterium]